MYALASFFVRLLKLLGGSLAWLFACLCGCSWLACLLGRWFDWLRDWLFAERRECALFVPNIVCLFVCLFVCSSVLLKVVCYLFFFCIGLVGCVFVCMFACLLVCKLACLLVGFVVWLLVR